MKPVVVVLLLPVIAVVGYRATEACLAIIAGEPSPETRLDWLAREFKLSPEAVSAIQRAQEDYAPICAEHCAAIADVEKRLAAATPTQRAQVEADLIRLRAVCATATRAHLETVAGCMPPDQGRRFLAMMEPRVAHEPGRIGAPTLDGPP